LPIINIPIKTEKSCSTMICYFQKAKRGNVNGEEKLRISCSEGKD
jgi:hypothetical protein